MPSSLDAAMPQITSHRMAVSLIFLVNGFLIGSWAPKIPEFAKRLQLDESELGLMILCFGAGSLCAMAVLGAAIPRYGSHLLVRIPALLSAPSLLPLTLAPSIWSAAIALFVFGGLIGGMDVAMNANAVEVERQERRAIMSSCHGFWSLGGVVGAGLGGLLIANAGIVPHALFATAFSGLAVAISWSRILSDPPGALQSDPNSPQATAQPIKLRAIGATVWLTGMICLVMMTPEGAILDWGALYMRQELGASPATSGLAFGAFAAAMALMRFLGDPVRDRFGAVNTFRVSSMFAILGLGVAGLATSPAWAVLGFALTGLGLANTVPIAFSAAGNLPGLPQGVAIAIVSFMGYSGILVAPSVIGFIAEHTGFALIFIGLPVLVAVAMMFSGLTHHADSDPGK